eukprot:3782607-Rhodomonas_salina.1
MLKLHCPYNGYQGREASSAFRSTSLSPAASPAATSAANIRLRFLCFFSCKAIIKRDMMLVLRWVDP